MDPTGVEGKGTTAHVLKLSTTLWRRIGSGGTVPRILGQGTRRRWGVSFKTRPLYPLGERATDTHCIGGWVGPRADLNTAVVKRKIPSPRRASNLRSSRPQPSAIPQSTTFKSLYEMNDSSSIPDRGTDCFFTHQQCPDWLWGPPILSNGYLGLSGGRAAGTWRWPPSSNKELRFVFCERWMQATKLSGTWNDREHCRL